MKSDILKLLAAQPGLTFNTIFDLLGGDRDHLIAIMAELAAERKIRSHVDNTHDGQSDTTPRYYIIPTIKFSPNSLRVSPSFQTGRTR